MIYKEHGKRMLDVVVSLAFLVCASPVIGLGIIAVRLSSPGPVFYLQARVGQGRKTFTIFKLRTMHAKDGRKLDQTRLSDPDVFPAGRVLRRFKIDEIPQFLNVLRGDMSLVGPRPGVEESFKGIPDWATIRFTVKPGLSGLAQIHGNAELSWEERWRYDVEYVHSCSLLQDLYIIMATMLVVVIGEDKFLRKR